MKIKHFNYIIAGFLSVIVFISCTQSVVYVSTKGNNSNSGAKSNPVVTIQKAVELSRSSGIKNIEILEGEYFDVSVVLNEKDSGLTISGEPGKTVRLYGGRKLEGWQQKNDLFEVQIPDSFLPKLDFRILIVNDSLRDRARLPETGAFTHENVWPHQWQSSQGGWSQKPTLDDLTTLYYNPADIGSWLDAKNAELTVFHAWDDSYVSLAGIDTVNHIFRFAYPATHPAGAFASWAGEKTHQYIIWNTREGITKPGQWYVDRSVRKIFYRPFAWEKSNEIRAMIPTKEHIFELQKNTAGITIENLQLSCVGAPIRNTGYATNAITGAVVGEKVSNISLQNVTVKNVAGWAVKVKGSAITISDCEFANTGAGGISFNGDHIMVKNCGIHDLGKLYFGAVGIIGDGSYNTISHCELFNIPYCAINGIGKKSVAEYNLMYNFKQTMIDGGAIYIYGGDSTIYRNNAVLSAKGNTTEGWTYYFDELSKNCIMENNLAVNTIVPVHHHMADKITIRNNVFIDDGRQKISYPLCSDLTFTGNIFAANEIEFSGPTGEKGNMKKESLNPVFQKYFECNGIVKFEDNRMFADTVVQNVLHVYSTIRNEPFRYTSAQWTKNPEIQKNWRSTIPEGFDETGYRNNFREIYSKMTGVK